MDITEKELQDYLAEHPEAIGLPGCKTWEEFDIAPYGRIDLLAFSELTWHDVNLENYEPFKSYFIDIHLVELKVEPFNAKHLSQLARYYTGFSELVCELHDLDYMLDIDVDIKCALVTKKREGSANCDDPYLVEFIESLTNHSQESMFSHYEFSLDLTTGLKIEPASSSNWSRLHDSNYSPKIVNSLNYILKETLEEATKKENAFK